MTNIILSIAAFLLINFNTLSYSNVDGNTINMSIYAGKKIMLVNIGTNSDKVGQLAQLKQLQQQFADSLVIILFPSNSFGKESRTNAQIKAFCQTNYNFTFKIAAKSNVTGASANTVYKWLAQKTQNGDMDAVTGNDFQKFIISKNGEIMGEFSSKISPLDPQILTVINTNF
jgi:glutathione peroxidase